MIVRIRNSIIVSGLYTLRFCCAYIIMFSIMTYNWGVCISLLVGIFCGKLIISYPTQTFSRLLFSSAVTYDLKRESDHDICTNDLISSDDKVVINP